MEALKLLDFMLLATLKGAPAQIIQPLLQLDHPNLTWQVFGDQKFSPCPVPRPSTEDGTGPKLRSWIIELHNFQLFARLTVAIMPIDGVKDLVQASLLIFQHPWKEKSRKIPRTRKTPSR